MLDKIGGALLSAATKAVSGDKEGAEAAFGDALGGLRPPPFEVAVDREEEGLFHNRSANFDQPGEAVVFRDRYRGGGASGESLGVEPRNPVRKFVVGKRSLAAELLEIEVEFLVERRDAWAKELLRDVRALEAGKPHAVANQNVVERAVDRFEESTPVEFAFFVAQRGR